MSSTGNYTFKWEHPNANDVWVTGTFDDWKKTIQLEKKGETFEKTVDLPTGQKFLYKFVVDGAWILDESKPSETDHQSIANNVLHPSDIVEKSAAVPAAAAATAATAATVATAATAATISSVGPNATTTKMVGDLPKEETSGGVPGAFVETPAAEADKAFSVAPIPATGGVGNPVHLAPGESIPQHHELTANTVTSNVKTDKASYENADAGAAKDIYNDTNAAVPPVSVGRIIPESSLPVGEGAGATPFIASAGAGTTTAEKVGALPKEPELPNVVVESQAAAHAAPEASANPEAVAEKKEVEAELKSKVPETAAVTGSTSTEPAATVPPVVAESIEKSKQGAEAAANPEAVEEKKEVESQLLKEVKPSNETGEPAPTTTAATSSKAPEPTTASTTPPAATTPKKDTSTTPASDKKSKRKSVMLIFDKIKHKISK